ncbi:MAG: flavodoxin [Anaerolineaceae bacterium]|nr:flavodoxin [Anaerolineaceae bacterium]
MAFHFDETDPQMLIVYTGSDHTPEDYRQLGQYWADRLQQDSRFGVLIVNEPHEHHHLTDEEREEHEREHEEINRLINAFRREYRHLSHLKTMGYVNVYPADAAWVVSAKAEEGRWQQWQETADSRARYMFGTRGNIFTDVDEAKQWLKAQTNEPPIELRDDSPRQTAQPSESSRVGLYYGSSTGVTEKVAYDIQSAWQQATGETLEPINIGTVKDLSELLAYNCLILGVPTWNIGQLQDDWDIAFPQLQNLNLAGCKIALFGIGDQYNYPDNFLDALGILGHELVRRGATLVGYTDASGYEFSESLGLESGQFMGLGIDETHQPDLTQSRITQWVTQLIRTFNVTPVASLQ